MCESQDCGGVVGRQVDAGVGVMQALTSHSGLHQAWGNWDPRPNRLAAPHCSSPPNAGEIGGPRSGRVLQAPLWREERGERRTDRVELS